MRRRAVICVETGERFPSMLSAARAYGTTNVCIDRAIRRGIRAAGYHWALTGPGFGPPANSRQILCLDTGKTLESITAAAALARCSPKAVTICIEMGTTCRGYRFVYADDPDRTPVPKPTPKRMGRPPRPVRRMGDGAIFPSIKAAAEEMGIRPCNLCTAISRRTRCGGEYWQYADGDPNPTRYRSRNR